ncbi:hypothetical protein ACLE20_05360 [Rhizobium sp. YIM 134829]|uniref:hypothetical protein n=1 Tax=Rhizobium sp. YIM 134829 TaxID=3390453 RepID=UPI0039783B3F
MSKIFDPENRFPAALAENEGLGGGGGASAATGRPKQDPDMPSRDELDAKAATIDAKLSATEARIEASMSSMRTSFAEHTAHVNQALTRMQGDVSAIQVELKHMPTTWTMITTMGGFSAAVVGVILGVMSFASDRFDGGFAMGSGLSAPFEAIRAENRQLVAEQSKRIDALDRKLDVLIDAVQHNQTSQKP